jgi:hypothetical protein
VRRRPTHCIAARNSEESTFRADLSGGVRGNYYEHATWDRQFEADVAAGKLDKIAAEALDELDRGETSDLLNHTARFRSMAPDPSTVQRRFATPAARDDRRIGRLPGRWHACEPCAESERQPPRYHHEMHARDTSDEAAAVQEEAYRRIGPVGRFNIAAELTNVTRELARAGIQRRHPGFTPEQVSRELTRYLYRLPIDGPED